MASLIVLNGTSSSGKTTLARALLERLDGPWLSIQGDQFLAMTPSREKFTLDEWASFWRGAYGAIAAFARAGNSAVVDIIAMKAFWLSDLAEAFDGVDALFVGVRCPLDIAEAREHIRVDAKDPIERRAIGIARRQFEIVHEHGIYDVEVDTSLLSPDQCAAMVIDRLNSGPREAFANLRSSLRR
jgi:chloramphenicol 3-O phosphotransferase